MKILIAVFVVFLLGISAFAEVPSYPRQIADPDDFLLLPWGGVWLTEIDNDIIFKEMAEMGFNTTCFIKPDQVKYAKKYGLKAIVQDDGLADNSIEDLSERYDKWGSNLKEAIGSEYLDCVYEVYVRDEPTANDDLMKELSAKSDAVRKHIGCKPYINLFPDYASPQQLGTDSYDEYLDYYVKNCNLDYISYDHYAFSLGTAPNIPGMTYNEGGAGFNENGFYGNLETVRKAAIRNKVGFVNIIQSVGALHWPTPDDYIIHVQGWSTLAYGGKGLSYFTLFTPNMGNWRDAPYDEYGFKSPVWRYVTHMNYAINNISNVYKNLENINVFHIGNVPNGCNDMSSAKNIKNLDFNLVNGTVNILVGEFVDKEGKQYAIIVNKDPKYSIAIGKIEFNKGTNIKKVEDRSYGDEIKPFGGEDVYIMPGHGVLLFAE